MKFYGFAFNGKEWQLDLMTRIAPGKYSAEFVMIGSKKVIVAECEKRNIQLAIENKTFEKVASL